jgi:general stress protein CsbA
MQKVIFEYLQIYKMTFNSIHKIKFDCIFLILFSRLPYMALYLSLFLGMILFNHNTSNKLQHRTNIFINTIKLYFVNTVKCQNVSGRCLILCSDHYVFSLRIPFIKITMQTIDKRAVTKRCRRKITEGQ